jgi:phosphohistidine phosphatase
MALLEPVMQLYLLRHGIAENGRPGARDADRALTPEGKKKLREVLRTAARAGVAPDYILTSPYLRAVETAEIASEVLRFKSDMIRSKALVPESSPEDLWEEVRVYKGAGQILVSSHEPLLSRAVAYLLSSPSLAVDMKKGGLVRIDLEGFGPEPSGLLKWYLVPKLAE